MQEYKALSFPREKGFPLILKVREEEIEIDKNTS